jgi:plasmid stabilization system protein ParE
MCYSAQIRAEYKKYVRRWGADISLTQYFQLYWDRRTDAKIKIPRVTDAEFANPANDDERKIKELIDEFNTQQAAKFEQELFKQRKRLADAERTLQTKTTKKATEDKRIATDKIEWAKDKLARLRSTVLDAEDARIFPGWYAPVMIIENGKYVVKAMRYQSRIARAAHFSDVKFPGTYNARRDNLEGYWRKQFGYSHGIMAANAFYENVSRHKMEGRELAPSEEEENVILEFRPNTSQEMLVACLWSHWQGPANRICFHSRRSPMILHRRSQQPVTTAASFRSSQRTSTHGLSLTRRISRPSTQSLLIASGRITSIGLQHRRV